MRWPGGAAFIVVLGIAGCDGTSPSAKPLTGAISVSAGDAHTCAVMNDGTARCWGDDSSGQIGNGEMAFAVLAPATVVGLSDVSAVAAGNQHTCALETDGTVACWGANEACQLGSGCIPGGLENGSQAAAVPTPTGVAGLSGPAVAIQTAGLSDDDPGYTCALLSGGTIECWGANELGLVADSSVANIAPTAVPGVTGALAMAVSGQFGCDVRADRTVECWGLGPLGQPGGAVSSSSPTPIPVPGLSGVVGLAAGYFHVCALTSAGAVWCWGDNSSGQLGDGTLTGSPTPVMASGIGGAISIATSAYATCAVLADGTVRCWGEDLDDPAPTPVAGVTGAVSVSTAELSACAVIGGGEIECWGSSWGSNGSGQLGAGIAPSTNPGPPPDVPVTVVSGD
jgi:alpha-tubulin suppressor-like RCC1 family protein